jgi:hypothetical protein
LAAAEGDGAAFPELFLPHLIQMFGADWIAIHELKQATQRLKLRHSVPFSSAERRHQMSLAVGEDIVGAAALLRRTVHAAQPHGPRLAEPILWGQRLIGVLEMALRRPLPSEDLAHVATAATLLASWMRTAMSEGSGDDGVAATSSPCPERQRILRALERTRLAGTGRWNIAHAARVLGIPRKTLEYRIRRVHRLTHPAV